MAFWIVLILVVLLALWIRSSRMRDRIDELEQKLAHERDDSPLVSALIARVRVLEQTVHDLKHTAPDAEPTPAPRPQLPITPVAAIPLQTEFTPPPPPRPPIVPPLITPEPVPELTPESVPELGPVFSLTETL